MSTARTLSYRNDLSELSRMAEELCAYCRAHGVDPDTTLALTLCMNELFANSVLHGYGKAEQPQTGGEAEGGRRTEGGDGNAMLRGRGACESAANLTGNPTDDLPDDLTGNPAGEPECGEGLGAMPARYPVEILLERFENRLEACYSDNACAFDPFALAAAPLPDVDVPPEELPTGGFGLHLLRRMSTSRSYTRKDGRNRVFLSFVWR